MSPRRRFESCRPAAAPAVLSPALIGSGAVAAEEGYRSPGGVLADMVDAPATPGTSVSPDGTRMVLIDRPSLSTLSVATMLA